MKDNMKTISSLVAAAAVACLFCTTTEAAKPEKRTLAPLVVTVTPNADPAGFLVIVKGDCNSANANIEYNVPVSVTYTVIEVDPETLDVVETISKTVTLDGLAELEVTIALAKTEVDATCDGTEGSTSFLIEDIDAAVQTAIAELMAKVPADATDVSSDTGCQFVAAKAWTESNSIADSKPTEVLAGDCEE